MPIYEYRCQACGAKKEVLQKISGKPLKECSECGKASMTKMISAAGFQLKGSGWYATDFKSGAKPQAEATKNETRKNEPKKDQSKKDGAKPSGDAKAKADAPSGASASPAPTR
ncbi:MAG: FmdB family zinc ribbon protein [Burkholderiales bacterium]